MSAARKTRQGVRDLNDEKQRNRRTRNDPTLYCFHQYKHSVDCPCGSLYFFDYDGPCRYACSRCGRTKQI